MDLFLGYFGAVSISCGCYFVLRMIVTLVLIVFLPIWQSCTLVCKKIYLQWIPPIITLTLSICLIILGIQFYDILSKDDRLYDPLAFICYFLIVIFTFAVEILFQVGVLNVPYLKKILSTRKTEGSIQYEDLYQGNN